MYLFFLYENIFILVASCQNKTNSKFKKRKEMEDLDNRDDSRKKKNNKVLSNPTYYTILPTYSKYIGVYTPELGVFFWLSHMACGILVPQPGIEPGPSAVKAWSPNHQTAREFSFTLEL